VRIQRSLVPGKCFTSRGEDYLLPTLASMARLRPRTLPRLGAVYDSAGTGDARSARFSATMSSEPKMQRNAGSARGSGCRTIFNGRSLRRKHLAGTAYRRTGRRGLRMPRADARGRRRTTLSVVQRKKSASSIAFDRCGRRRWFDDRCILNRNGFSYTQAGAMRGTKGELVNGTRKTQPGNSLRPRGCRERGIAVV